MTAYETVIGLEVHCQLALASKLFSRAPAAFGGDPNTRVSPVDMGLPGVLPVLNDRALRLALRAALALQGSIQRHPEFELTVLEDMTPDAGVDASIDAT